MAAMEFMCSPENDDDDDGGLGGVREGVCVESIKNRDFSSKRGGVRENYEQKNGRNIFVN